MCPRLVGTWCMLILGKTATYQSEDSCYSMGSILFYYQTQSAWCQPMMGTTINHSKGMTVAGFVDGRNNCRPWDSPAASPIPSLRFVHAWQSDSQGGQWWSLVLVVIFCWWNRLFVGETLMSGGLRGVHQKPATVDNSPAWCWKREFCQRGNSVVVKALYWGLGCENQGTKVPSLMTYGNSTNDQPMINLGWYPVMMTVWIHLIQHGWGQVFSSWESYPPFESNWYISILWFLIGILSFRFGRAIHYHWLPTLLTSIIL